MPVILKCYEEAEQLRGLKWVCHDCLAVNKPQQLDCGECGKQRWGHLGINRQTAFEVAQQVKYEARPGKQ